MEDQHMKCISHAFTIKLEECWHPYYKSAFPHLPIGRMHTIMYKNTILLDFSTSRFIHFPVQAKLYAHNIKLYIYGQQLDLY